MPFVRLHWLSGEKTDQWVEDITADRIAVTKPDGTIRTFLTTDVEEDGRPAYIEEPFVSHTQQPRER